MRIKGFWYGNLCLCSQETHLVSRSTGPDVKLSKPWKQKSICQLYKIAHLCRDIFLKQKVTLVGHGDLFSSPFFLKGADEEPDYYLKLLSQSKPTQQLQGQ